MIKRILRRWYVILIVAVVFSGTAIFLIWYFMENQFTTTGALSISRFDNPIVFQSHLDKLPPYDLYKNTQAETIKGSNVLNRVADDLAAKNLPIFQESKDPLPVLRQMVDNEDIKVVPEQNTEYIRLTMTTPDPSQAETIIDSFLTSYMAWLESEKPTGGMKKLKILEDKKRQLKDDIDSQERDLNKLVNEFGSRDINPRQEMMLEVVARLQQDLIGITMQRIGLEARVQLMENDNADPLSNTDKAQRQNAYINSNPVVQALSQEVAHHEVLVAKSNGQSGDNDPNLQDTKKTLEALNNRLSELQEELTAKFEKRYEAELAQNREIALAQAKAELAQAVEHENKLREKLKELDTDTIDVGRTQLNLYDQKQELAQIRQMYDMVVRRIEEIEFEQNRPSRISIAQRASSVPAEDCRLEMSIASVPVGLLLGVLFAGLLGRKKVR